MEKPSAVLKKPSAVLKKPSAVLKKPSAVVILAPSEQIPAFRSWKNHRANKKNHPRWQILLDRSKFYRSGAGKIVERAGKTIHGGKFYSFGANPSIAELEKPSSEQISASPR